MQTVKVNQQAGTLEFEPIQVEIKTVFNRHDHQQDVLIDLYKLVLPDWDQIKKLRGYPKCGHTLWKLICRSFQEFDQRHHPNCMPAGIWLNAGFASYSSLLPWSVSLKNCTVEYLNQT